MEHADELKNKGNEAFMSGDDAAATAFYERAIGVLEAADSGVDANSAPCVELRRNLYSNLSNVLLGMGKYEESCRAAATALEIDPTFVKASLRYVKARMLAGYTFDAFVYALRNTRPLVRVLQGNGSSATAAKEAATALRELEAELSGALGISKLSSGFELIDYHGGVDMVSRKAFSHGEVIFAEEKYKTRFDEGSLNDGAGGTSGMTTEDIVRSFAEHIRPEQQANSTEWQSFKRDFVGAWPRTVDDVDEFTRKHVGEHVRPIFPDLAEDEFSELLLTSLMCRYNCFYTGFFRTCALANHSCRANIAMKYNPATETVTMVAVTDIKPGELMNVKYLNDACFLLGLCKRRELLRAWLFWCRCARCQEDNDAKTAVQEFVGCPDCHRYTHYPIPAPSIDIMEGDPMAVAAPKCAHCGAAVAWSEDKLQRFYRVAECPLSNPSVRETGEWLVAKMSEVGALDLHPAHWIYRVLFYYFCLNANGAVQRHLGTMLQTPNGAARGEEARRVLRSFGLRDVYTSVLDNLQKNPHHYASAEAPGVSASPLTPGIVSDGLLVNTSASTHGCDTLRALCILCNVIGPFYPNSEMWAVHKLICECVMIQILYQCSVRLPDAEHLSQEQAVQLLQEHGPQLGEQGAARWMHTYNLLKAFVTKEDERNLPSMATLKKLFKSK